MLFPLASILFPRESKLGARASSLVAHVCNVLARLGAGAAPQRRRRATASPPALISLVWARGSIDDMYSSLIDARHLDAYIMTPTVFYQDFYFGSSLASEGEINPRHRAIAGETHRPFTALCSQMTPYSTHTFAEAAGLSGYHRALLASLLTPSDADAPWLHGTWAALALSVPATKCGANSERDDAGKPPGSGCLHGCGSGGLEWQGRVAEAAWRLGCLPPPRHAPAHVQDAPGAPGAPGTRLLVIMSDSLLERPIKLGAGRRVVYYARRAGRPASTVQIGVWPHGLLGHHAVALLLDDTCQCLPTISEDGCQVQAVIEDELDGPLGDMQFELSPDHLLRTPLPPRLVCYMVASRAAVDASVLFKPESRVLSLTWQHPSSAPSVLHVQDASPAQQRAALFRRMVEMYSLPMQRFEYLVFVQGSQLPGLSPDDVRQFEEALSQEQPPAALLFGHTCRRSCAQIDSQAVLTAVRWDMWHEMAAVFAAAASGQAVPVDSASVPSESAPTAPAPSVTAAALPSSDHTCLDAKSLRANSVQASVSGRSRETIKVWLTAPRPDEPRARRRHKYERRSARHQEARGVRERRDGAGGASEWRIESGCGQLAELLRAIARGSDVRLTRQASPQAQDADSCLGVRDAAQFGALPADAMGAGQTCRGAGVGGGDAECPGGAGPLVLLDGGEEPVDPTGSSLRAAVLSFPT